MRVACPAQRPCSCAAPCPSTASCCALTLTFMPCVFPCCRCCHSVKQLTDLMYSVLHELDNNTMYVPANVAKAAWKAREVLYKTVRGAGAYAGGMQRVDSARVRGGACRGTQ